MVQVPGQHSTMYAANTDGILACSTEHKDGCQMQWSVPRLWRLRRVLKMGFFSADDDGMFIYASLDFYESHKVAWIPV
jgi:hypothetical protein